MRLENLNSGHGLKAKFIMKMIKLIMGEAPPDVVRLLQYRPDFFGKEYSSLLQDIMRKSKGWGVGELELFAAFVSGKNQCPF
ncbi:MAG: hypothetical protein ACRBF0_20575 [Calditrichia bacterium]